MSKVSYYSEEGLKNLRDELNQLRDIEKEYGRGSDEIKAHWAIINEKFRQFVSQS